MINTADAAFERHSRIPYTNDLESVESFEKHLKEFLDIKELALAWEDSTLVVN